MPSQDPSASSAGDERHTGAGPSALGLARLSPGGGLPPGGEGLYRHIARLVELAPDREFVVAPCGRGATSRLLAEASGASGAGTDPDAELVEEATAAARKAGLSERLHYEHAPLDELPYKDAVFDVALGEIGLAATAVPETAVRELVRVLKPGGTIVLIQPIWMRTVEPERRSVLVEHLGVRPFLLMEWKQMLRDAGVGDLYVEDWSEALGMLRLPLTLRKLSEFFSLRDRLAILFRALQRWGIRGGQKALAREQKIRGLVAEDPVLGVSLIKGTKCPGPPASAP